MNQHPQVECHSEHQYAERPTAFTWDGERILVTEIIAQWRTLLGVHFRVLTATHGIFNLSYHELEDVWEVQQS